MKKNRSYKKGNPYRDCSLVIIACEGSKTEPKYFSFFEQIHPRKCRVEILKNEEGIPHKSAPKRLLESVQKYRDKNQIGDGDFLFIVSDVDRWEPKSLQEIDSFCKDLSNHFFIISNPCFEVWLYYHLGDPRLELLNTCKDWKALLHKKTETGFQIEKFAMNISKAILKAKKDDQNPDHYLPTKNHSKVYKVVETILSKIGEGNFQKFINNS